MKKVFIDANVRTQNNIILVSKFIVDNMELQAGERAMRKVFGEDIMYKACGY